MGLPLLPLPTSVPRIYMWKSISGTSILYVCSHVNIMLSWFLYLYNKSWNQYNSANFFFAFPYRIFRITLSFFLNKCCWDFNWDCIESINQFGRTDIFIILHLLIHEHVVFPFKSFFISLHHIWQFWVYISCTYFAKFIPKYFIFWDVIVK